MIPELLVGALLAAAALFVVDMAWSRDHHAALLGAALAALVLAVLASMWLSLLSSAFQAPAPPAENLGAWAAAQGPRVERDDDHADRAVPGVPGPVLVDALARST